MKKNDFTYFAIFLVIALFVIPMSAFLASEIIGQETTKTISAWAYKLLKDHGSLAAGILGFGGVFLMIANQNENTNKLIKEERSKIRRAVFDQNKENALEQLALFNKKLGERREMRILLKKGENIVTPINFSNMYLDRSLDNLFHLNKYIRRCNSTNYLSLLMTSTRRFLLLTQEALYYKDHGDERILFTYGESLRVMLIMLKDVGEQECAGEVLNGFNYPVRSLGSIYSLQDIIQGIDDNIDPDNLESLYKYLGICFIWLKGAFNHGVGTKIAEISFIED